MISKYISYTKGIVLILLGIILFCIPLFMPMPEQLSNAQKTIGTFLPVIAFFLIIVGIGLVISKRMRDKKFPLQRRERPY